MMFRLTKLSLSLLCLLLLSACASDTPAPSPVAATATQPADTPSPPPQPTDTPPPASPTPTSSPTSPPPTEAPPPTPTSITTEGQEDTATLLERLGGAPCPESDFTCITLTLPLDHFDPDAGETLEVVFAVLPATGERKGMFVTATGGPGYSGLAAADAYTAAFDPTIPAQFDIVFFDQRGVVASEGVQCPAAAAVYYQAEGQANTPAGEALVVEAAQTFATGCLAELGSSERLDYFGTRQAVEDLERFRQIIGDDKFWLYGESYGTQFAQTYAAAHPDHLAGLILDGTVDLTLTIPDYLAEQAQAFNDVLVLTLTACNEDAACAADAGGDALAVYDDLAARLAAAPLPFTFPTPSGGTSERRFSLTDLEVAVSEYLYSEASRLLLQRAMAAAAHDDLVPLARLLYSALYLDPDTLEAIPDPTYSDAAYYSVECNDYFYPTATTYLDEGDEVDESVPRLSSIFYGDLPCVFWPVEEDAPDRPTSLLAEGVPTLVLGATADPATPVANGQRVYEHLTDGYLVTTTGGAHVIFGRGNPCPDELVTAFLVEDALPEERETLCEGVIADPYIPLAPSDAGDFADPLEALASAENEIYYLPEYYYWDQTTPTTVGCPYGGTLAFETTDEGDQFTLTACAFSAGFAMTGTGSYNYEADKFILDVAITGLASGDLLYVRDGDEDAQVTGEYDGRPVDLPE